MALDVGEKRIGVALGDSGVRIAIPFTTIVVDGTEVGQIGFLVAKEAVDTLVIGYPRNQSGEATAQTKFVEDFATQLKGVADELVFQDESLTSVLAEERLKSYGRPYEKGDVDALAAAIILQDYIEVHNAA